MRDRIFSRTVADVVGQAGQYTGRDWVKSGTRITMTGLFLLILALASLVAAPLNVNASTIPNPDDPAIAENAWPMLAANPERTSWTPEEVRGELNVDWYRPIEPYIPYKIQPIAANGNVYVSTAGGLYTFSADNGDSAVDLCDGSPAGALSYHCNRQREECRLCRRLRSENPCCRCHHRAAARRIFCVYCGGRVRNESAGSQRYDLCGQPRWLPLCARCSDRQSALAFPDGRSDFVLCRLQRRR